MGVKFVCAHDTTQDYEELTDVKLHTQPVTPCCAAQIQKNVAPHEPPWLRGGGINNCRSTDVGERSEDVIERFGSEQARLVFVYVTLNKKQT